MLMRIGAVAFAICIGAALVSGAVLSGLFAILRLPVPEGPYAVGTVRRIVDLADDRDRYTDASHRRIEVELWYPAQHTGSDRRARYRFSDGGSVSLRTRFARNLVRTDAYLDARVADHSHAVLLYFPSWGGTRADNTVLAEDLASDGFIVVGMDDLYPEPPMDFSSTKAFRASLQWADAKVRLEASAAQHVLDTLAAWNAADSSGRFTAHLDMSRVGAIGFSFGGAVAAEVARNDRRVRAAADLDGWLFGEAARQGVAKPFIVIGAPESNELGPRLLPAERNTVVLNRIDDRHMLADFRRDGGFLLTIAGTEHYNFSDLPFVPTLRHDNVGPIDGRRATHIIEAYITEFFGHYLYGRPAALLGLRPGQSSPDPLTNDVDTAAQLEVWPPPRAGGIHAPTGVTARASAG
jgi:dienelactone hydrolase